MIKKKTVKQTGKSNRTADAARKAKAPGKRTSSTGKTYTETRKNRTDLPGYLTGGIAQRKKYTNQVEINGKWYTNTIEAYDYKEALQLQKERKRKSKNKFRGRLTLNEF